MEGLGIPQVPIIDFKIDFESIDFWLTLGPDFGHTAEMASAISKNDFLCKYSRPLREDNCSSEP